ncbi:MAG TPA: transcriptional antiterminator, Rof [Gammaproteobacteria bacterium]|nr:transcriptional antiterminator, Rof [Gammaproteobacteria bacterium]
MTDYRPIDCALYSRYEVAILHRERLRVCWRDAAAVTHLEILQPQDLQTRSGAEYLIATGKGGQRLELRLDRILEAMPLEEAGAHRP